MNFASLRLAVDLGLLPSVVIPSVRTLQLQKPLRRWRIFGFFHCPNRKRASVCSMKKAKLFELGFLVAERRGLFSNPNFQDLVSIHGLFEELKQNKLIENDVLNK